MIFCQNKMKKTFHSRITLWHVFLQRKKRASQRSEWLMENQRKWGNLEPFIPASNWLHSSGGFKRRSIWLCRSGPSWQLLWALRKHRWVRLQFKYSLSEEYEFGVSRKPFHVIVCVCFRSRFGFRTGVPSSRSCGKMEKFPPSNMLLQVSRPPALLLQLLPGIFHKLREWTVSTPLYLRAAVPPTRLRLRRFWPITPGTRPRTLRRICSLWFSITTTLP